MPGYANLPIGDLQPAIGEGRYQAESNPDHFRHFFYSEVATNLGR
jgi:hypothetical protein